jgi:hypothetical protein
VNAATRTLGWGVFCACSWTWCIGMFMPVLMYERYGVVGFLAFAVPNVLGCAGFGYVLGTRAASERLLATHGLAAMVFSSVAIAFQVFFATYLFTEVVPLPGGVAGGTAAGLVLLAAGLTLAWLPDRAWLALAAVTFVLSCVIFVLVRRAGTSWPTPDHRLSELAWLAPVIALGFLLCPYLDLTFHRALQRAPSRHAFGVFGVTFTVMILMTCPVWFALPASFRAFGVVHLCAQMIFTVGAHLRELRTAPRVAPSGRAVLMAAPLVALAVLPIGSAVVGAEPVEGLREGVGIDLYVRFLVFYGLLFPAYVLVFVGPARPLPTTPRALLGTATVTIALLPLYEIGFLHGPAWVLAVPIALAAAWLSTRRGPRLGAAAPIR